MKMAVLGDEEFVWGVMLAGIRNARTTTGPDDTREILTEWLRTPDIGVILLAGFAADQVRPFLATVRKSKRLYPLIIEIGNEFRPEHPGTTLVEPEKSRDLYDEGSNG